MGPALFIPVGDDQYTLNVKCCFLSFRIYFPAVLNNLPHISKKPKFEGLSSFFDAWSHCVLVFKMKEQVQLQMLRVWLVQSKPFIWTKMEAILSGGRHQFWLFPHCHGIPPNHSSHVSKWFPEATFQSGWGSAIWGESAKIDIPTLISGEALALARRLLEYHPTYCNKRYRNSL